MVSTSRFRVVSAFAVMQNLRHRHFVTIPVGSIVETSDDLHQPGFVQVNIDGNAFLAFKRDIKERTQPLRSATPTAGAE
jgi:hypothetical protein